MPCRSFKPGIFFTLPVCGIVISLVCTSLITDQWVSGNAKTIGNQSVDTPSTLIYNYGLFRGAKTVNIFGSGNIKYSLKYVCKGSGCMYSCVKKAKDDIENLFTPCPFKSTYYDITYCNRKENGGDESGDIVLNAREEECGPYSYEQTDIAGMKKLMMRRGVWGSVIAFIAIGLVFTVVSSIFGALNAFSTPIEAIVGVHGLIAWNGIAAFCYFLVVALWAGEYNTRLRKAVPITQMLRKGGDKWTSQGLANLSYSYWILLACMLCHLLNICLVVYFIYRKYKPKRKVVDIGYEKGPDNVILY